MEKDLERLVISVGPTIGLGDETILAKALVERANLSHATLYVETRRYDIWNWLGGQTAHIGDPPVSSIDYINSLGRASREKTGYIYADFLTSDPSHVPYYVPHHIGFSGRWIFGNASGIIVDPKKRVTHRFRYPDGMPPNRNIECAWMARRFLPFGKNIGILPEESYHTGDCNGNDSILIMPLTSKPNLIFPASFYQRCFKELLCLTGRPIDFRILTSPTVAAQEITDAIYHGLVEALSPSHVTRLEPMDLAGVQGELDKAGLLFGTDTFTGHWAAIKGLPQVTISLSEHGAWMTPATPSFFLTMQQDLERLSVAAARRMAFVLEGSPFIGREVMREYAKTWRSAFSQIGTTLKKYAYGMDGVDLTETSDHIKIICKIIRKSRHIVDHTIGQYLPTDYKACLNFDLGLYEEYDDAMCALGGWYHCLGSSDLSGLFFNTP